MDFDSHDSYFYLSIMKKIRCKIKLSSVEEKQTKYSNQGYFPLKKCLSALVEPFPTVQLKYITTVNKYVDDQLLKSIQNLPV